jgi:hypothetical protein
VANGSGSVTLTPGHSGSVTLTATAGTLRGITTLTVYPSLFVYSCNLTAYDANGDLVTGAEGETSGNYFVYRTPPEYLAAAQINQQIVATEDALSQQLEDEGYDMGLGSLIHAGPVTQTPAN